MKRNYISFLLIIILGFVVYSTALKVPFLWDDIQTIENNKYIMGWSWRNIVHNFTSDYFNTGSNYYRPIPTLLNMVNFSLWGLRPLGFHLANLIMHILNAVLIYLLFNLLFHNDKLSLLTAIFFVVHPINVNLLSHVADNITLLCSFFILISMYLFFKYPSLTFYLISNFSFLVALVCKESAVIYPFLMICLIFIFYAEKKKKYIIRTIPFFILLIIYLFLRTLILNNAYPSIASGKLFLFFVVDFPRVIFEYINILLAPFNIYMVRYVPSFTYFINIFCSLIFFTGVGVIIWRKSKVAKILKFSSVWFISFLLPTFPVLIDKIMFEHWIYLSSASFFFLIALLCYHLIYARYNLLKIIGSVLIAILLIFYGVLARYNISFRQDEVTFFSKILQYTPLPKLYHNLGNVYMSKGDYQKSIYFFQNAVEKEPITLHFRSLGTAYISSGDYDKAIAIFRKIIKDDPNDSIAHLNLGLAYLRKDMIKDAIREEEESLKINPEEEIAYFILGQIYIKIKEKPKAQFYYKEALKINPYFSQARNNLGCLYAEENDLERAMNEWFFVHSFNPGDKLCIKNIKRAKKILGNE